MSVTVNDIADTLGVTEGSEVTVGRSGLSLSIAISDVEAWPSIAPTIETAENLPTKSVVQDAAEASTGKDSEVDELAMVEVVGILSDSAVVSFGDIVEITFPSDSTSDGGA